MLQNFTTSGGRGRGRGRGTPFRGQRSFNLSAPSSPLPPEYDTRLGLAADPLETIRKPEQAVGKLIQVKDLQYAGSYNWTNSSLPTIIVPGSPHEWTNRPTPYQVPADFGMFFIDQNGFRMPSATLLPLISAVNKKTEDTDEPAFAWSTSDFVTDRNGLRKLLRWIEGDPMLKDFRIDTQLAGHKTVLLNRWEKRTREYYSGYSYGFNFEKASTRDVPGCDNSTGHHRIITYDLNGLKMVVRFEVDACIPPPVDKEATVTTTPRSTNVDDLVGALAGVTITSQSESIQPPTFALKVIGGGSYNVPQSSLVEMTTRSEKRAAEFNWAESFPQLFFSQTPHHFLAIHQKGRFNIVKKNKLSGLKHIEDGLQDNLKRLRNLLGIIQGLVVAGGQRGRLSLVCEKGELKVFERISEKSCLPDEIIQLFDI